MNEVEICFSPALYPSYANAQDDRIVVVVDIFRATTTICTAFSNGARRIIPVASTGEAKAYQAKGYLVGAERNVHRCDFADFGNSPFEYAPGKVQGKDIVLTTTNCTQAIDVAAEAPILIIGSFLNMKAVAGFCVRQHKDVLVLCAGWNNRFNMEDTLFAGALASILQKHDYKASSDAAKMALKMWDEAQSDPVSYLSSSEHTQRLIENNLQDSIEYCLTPDTVNMVPVYNKTGKYLYIS